MNIDFSIVPDDRRRKRGNSRFEPLIAALETGKTVVVTTTLSANNNGMYQRMKDRGYVLHVRRDEDGTVMWAERVKK